jgi:phosphoglycerate dehydrogenase-like enzyme
MGTLTLVNILIPEVLFDFYAPDARAIAPSAAFIPYRDDETSPNGVEDVEAIAWWYTVQHIDEIVSHAPKLRWLHSGSAGVDRLLSPTVAARAGLTVTDSGPAFEISISEFVMAWILSVARRLPDLDTQQRRHEWNPLQQDEVWGKSVGIIGLGPIGRGVAARAKAFGMRTMGLRRSQKPAPHVDEVVTGTTGLMRLLGESDYVVVAAALTGETRALI